MADTRVESRPTARSGAAKKVHDFSPLEKGGRAVRGSRKQMKKWILLVEDDAVLRAALTDALTQANYAVITATAPREAIQKLRKQAFFCVICDLRLGEESGEEVIEYIRDSTKTDVDKRIPILVSSGNFDREVAERVLKRVNGALVKPFSIAQLLEKLKGLETADKEPHS